MSAAIPSLKRSKVVVAEKSTTKKSDIKTVEVDGEIVSRFNKAIADQKAAEAVVAECRPLVMAEGLKSLYETNVSNPGNPASSVKLMDEAGAVVRVTSQDRYSAVDPDAVVSLFESLSTPDNVIDPNVHVQEVVVPSFNAKIFYHANGDFSDAIFKAYQTAIRKVTNELIANGKLAPATESPLNGKSMFAVKPAFHAARWAAFPAVELQTEIFGTIKNTVTLTPCASEE